MWVGVGAASSQSTFMSGFSPFFSRVHTPRGPRKSGIPAEVEMPAPEIFMWSHKGFEEGLEEGLEEDFDLLGRQGFVEDFEENF